MNGSSSSAVVTVGIDIGSESCKVVLGPGAGGCEIVRSDVGNHTTPTAVSFSGKSRLIGEAANLRSNNTILHLNRLPASSGSTDGEEKDPFRPFYRFETDNDNAVTVDIEGTRKSFESAAVIAMLLGKIKKNVLSTLARRSIDSSNVEYVLSIPPGSSEKNVSAVLDAAYAAGLGNGDAVRVVDDTACTAAAYRRKFPEVESRTLMVVDMGHTQTCVSVLRISNDNNSSGTDGEADDKETKEEKEEQKEKSEAVQILSSVCHRSLGAGSVDIRLWEHFGSSVPALKGLSKPSRGGHRLLDACKRLKQLLSQLPDGSVTAENINDNDVKISCSQSTLKEICAPEHQALAELIQQALEKANTPSSDVDSVEVLGGGCRIPFVKSTIIETLTAGGGKVASLSYSLDDTSVALGAGVIGTDQASKWLKTSSLPKPDDQDADDAQETTETDATEKDAYRQKLMEAEQQMAAIDDTMAQKGEIRNKIEAHILEMRSAQSGGKHSDLLSGCSTELNKHLDEADDWLFSEEAEDAGIDKMQEKLDSTVQKTKEMCKTYFDTIQKEEEAKDRQMEEEAKQAQAERNAGGDNNDDDDHDNRRLPKKRRMEIVMKNKAEANELFSDGNYRHAAARYTKALTHAAKFVDLSPDDMEEVKSVKLSLNLNLALSYFKLQNFDQSLRVCNEALQIDDKSTKALYRRASVYFEKKKWDDAKKDITKALSIKQDDKAIQKLQQKVDWHLKKQKAKEKKMAQKMFG